MKRFKNILAVYGDQIGSDAVLDRASLLARQNDATLTVLEVGAEESPRGYVEEHKRRLERTVERIRSEGVDVRTLVTKGLAFYEITVTVLRNEHDLVILAAEAPGGFRNLLFGSTSMRVMRKCPCPVWVLKPDTGPRFQNILAAVDPRDSEQEGDALDHEILQLASTLAERERANLHIVHAWKVRGNDALRLRSELPDGVRREIEDRHTRMARTRVERLSGPDLLQQPSVSIHVREGVASSVIPNVEREVQADLVVMGTIARSYIPGFLIGSMAEIVLRQVNCSVLTVKPDQFVSPITVE